MHGCLLCRLYRAAGGGQSAAASLSPIHETINVLDMNVSFVDYIHVQCRLARSGLPLSFSLCLQPCSLLAAPLLAVVSCLSNIQPRVFPVKLQAQSLLVSMWDCAAVE